MNNQELSNLASDLTNWKKATEVSIEFPQFTRSQLKALFWKRAQHPGLSRCYRQVGKFGYVNVPLFGLWLAGALPEQKADEQSVGAL